MGVTRSATRRRSGTARHSGLVAVVGAFALLAAGLVFGAPPADAGFCDDESPVWSGGEDAWVNASDALVVGVDTGKNWPTHAVIACAEAGIVGWDVRAGFDKGDLPRFEGGESCLIDLGGCEVESFEVVSTDRDPSPLIDVFVTGLPAGNGNYSVDPVPDCIGVGEPCG